VRGAIPINAAGEADWLVYLAMRLVDRSEPEGTDRGGRRSTSLCLK
jgi:hypothetical protein